MYGWLHLHKACNHRHYLVFSTWIIIQAYNAMPPIIQWTKAVHMINIIRLIQTATSAGMKLWKWIPPQPKARSQNTERQAALFPGPQQPSPWNCATRRLEMSSSVPGSGLGTVCFPGNARGVAGAGGVAGGRAPSLQQQSLALCHLGRSGSSGDRHSDNTNCFAQTIFPSQGEAVVAAGEHGKGWGCGCHTTSTNKSCKQWWRCLGMGSSHLTAFITF